MELNLTKSINKTIEQSFINLHKKNQLYYIDVLHFFNYLLSDGINYQQFNCIKSLKFNYITINHEIIDLYNNIIDKFNISANKINNNLFNTNLPNNVIIDLFLFMSNNLLKLLHYKVISSVYKHNNKKFYKLSKI